MAATTTSQAAAARAQGARDAADGVPMIDRRTWEFYTAPMADAVWEAYCAGRGVSAK